MNRRNVFNSSARNDDGGSEPENLRLSISSPLHPQELTSQRTFAEVAFGPRETSRRF
jgi:hypothetical protein